MAVLVLQGMQQTFSERLYRGIYGIVEILGVVRCLCLMVAEEETVPQSYELHRWGSFELSNLRLSGGKQALMFQTFASHRSSYTCGGEYQHAVTIVEEFVVTVAMNLLKLSPLSDHVNRALACWSLDMLLHGHVDEMEELMGCFLEMLERTGRVNYAARTAMLESFVRFIRRFRDEHADDYDRSTHESDLWQYGSADVALCRLMKLCFCVSGSVNQSHSFVNMSLPSLSSEDLCSVLRTIASWCQNQGVRGLQSIPDALVSDSSDAIGRVLELAAVNMEDLWDEVGRSATDEYRESVFERMGLTASGEQAASPEIGREHRF